MATSVMAANTSHDHEKRKRLRFLIFWNGFTEYLRRWGCWEMSVHLANREMINLNKLVMTFLLLYNCLENHKTFLVYCTFVPNIFHTDKYFVSFAGFCIKCQSLFSSFRQNSNWFTNLCKTPKNQM
jgi:hypothetical protein